MRSNAAAFCPRCKATTRDSAGIAYCLARSPGLDDTMPQPRLIDRVDDAPPHSEINRKTWPHHIKEHRGKQPHEAPLAVRWRAVCHTSRRMPSAGPGRASNGVGHKDPITNTRKQFAVLCRWPPLNLPGLERANVMGYHFRLEQLPQLL